MRLWSIVAFGTGRFPEKVARRLRVVNLICWVSAAMLYMVALRRLFQGNPENWGVEAATVATMFAAIPLLHRFGSAAALIALIVLAYVDTWRVTLDGGTAGGYWLAFFAGSAFAVLILGAEHPVLGTLMAFASCVTTIAVHFYVPAFTGGQTTDDQFAALLINIARTQLMLFAVVFFGARQIARAEAAAEVERDRSDALLGNILPAAIADRLKREPSKKVADRHDAASVLFADMAGFTARAGTMTPQDLVGFLDGVYSAFDRLVDRHGLEKIKTTGDAYMVISGAPVPRPDHARALVALAFEMLAEASTLHGGVPIRIGIASGPLVGGVVGSRKFFYDVWGDTVNLASRLESTGETGRIHVSAATAGLVTDAYEVRSRGEVTIRGKGPVETFFVDGPRMRRPDKDTLPNVAAK